jgi:hypothetical protein
MLFTLNLLDTTSKFLTVVKYVIVDWQISYWIWGYIYDLSLSNFSYRHLTERHFAVLYFTKKKKKTLNKRCIFLSSDTIQRFRTNVKWR